MTTRTLMLVYLQFSNLLYIMVYLNTVNYSIFKIYLNFIKTSFKEQHDVNMLNNALMLAIPKQTK